MDKKVTLTIKELKRIHVIHEIQAGRMTARAAAELLGLSLRQVRRLIRRQREGGDAALAHGNRKTLLESKWRSAGQKECVCSKLVR